MKEFVLSLILGGLLVGCGTYDANIYGGLVGQRVRGNDTFVTISNVWNEMDALPLAETHCSKFGKRAKFNQMIGAGGNSEFRAHFDCV